MFIAPGNCDSCHRVKQTHDKKKQRRQTSGVYTGLANATDTATKRGLGYQEKVDQELYIQSVKRPMR